MTSREGIGMTSARTRERLVRRLQEQGIRSPAVLGRIRDVPRHLFVDEALASRAYEDTKPGTSTRRWRSVRAVATRRPCWRRS